MKRETEREERGRGLLQEDRGWKALANDDDDEDDRHIYVGEISHIYARLLCMHEYEITHFFFSIQFDIVMKAL